MRYFHDQSFAGGPRLRTPFVAGRAWTCFGFPGPRSVGLDQHSHRRRSPRTQRNETKTRTARYPPASAASHRVGLHKSVHWEEGTNAGPAHPRDDPLCGPKAGIPLRAQKQRSVFPRRPTQVRLSQEGLGNRFQAIGGAPPAPCHPCASPGCDARPPRQSTAASAALLTYGVHLQSRSSSSWPTIRYFSCFFSLLFFSVCSNVDRPGFTSYSSRPSTYAPALPATESRPNVNPLMHKGPSAAFHHSGPVPSTGPAGMRENPQQRTNPNPSRAARSRPQGVPACREPRPPIPKVTQTGQRKSRGGPMPATGSFVIYGLSLPCVASCVRVSLPHGARVAGDRIRRATLFLARFAPLRGLMSGARGGFLCEIRNIGFGWCRGNVRLCTCKYGAKMLHIVMTVPCIGLDEHCIASWVQAHQHSANMEPATRPPDKGHPCQTGIGSRASPRIPRHQRSQTSQPQSPVPVPDAHRRSGSPATNGNHGNQPEHARCG